MKVVIERCASCPARGSPLSGSVIPTMLDWYDITAAPHKRTFDHDGRLDSLPYEWERELAALWRLQVDVNSGGYIQFLVNWGYETYEHASRALKVMGAHRRAKLIDSCQALIDEHFDAHTAPRAERYRIVSHAVLGLKDEGSTLPDNILDRIRDLSYEFMNAPDDIDALGMKHYAVFIAAPRTHFAAEKRPTGHESPVSIEEWQLMSLFEVAPIVIDPGVAWPNNDFVFRHEKDGLRVHFWVAPACKDFTLLVDRGEAREIELTAMAVHDIRYQDENGAECLEILLNESERLELRLKPSFSLKGRVR